MAMETSGVSLTYEPHAMKPVGVTAKQPEVQTLIARLDRLRTTTGELAVLSADVAAKLCGSVPEKEDAQQGIGNPGGLLGEIGAITTELERLSTAIGINLNRMRSVF